MSEDEHVVIHRLDWMRATGRRGLCWFQVRVIGGEKSNAIIRAQKMVVESQHLKKKFGLKGET